MLSGMQTPRSPIMNRTGDVNLSTLTPNLGLPTATPTLKTVIQAKERELAHLNEQRITALEFRIRDLDTTIALRDEEVAKQRQAYADLERDFAYNLTLIQERDRELSRLDRDLNDTKRAVTEAQLQRAKAESHADEVQMTLSTQIAALRRDLEVLQEAHRREMLDTAERQRRELLDATERHRRDLESLQDAHRRELEMQRREFDTTREEMNAHYANQMALQKSELTKELTREHQERMDTARMVEVELRSRLDALGSELGRAQGEVGRTNGENARLQARCRELESDVDRMRAAAEEASHEVRRAQQMAMSAEGESDAARRDAQRLAEAADRTHREWMQRERMAVEEGSAARHEVEQLRATLHDAHRSLLVKEEAARDAAARLDMMQRDVHEARGRAASLDAQCEAHRSTIHELEHALNELRRELGVVAVRAANAEDRASALTRTVDELRAKMSLKALEEETRAAGSWTRRVEALSHERDRAADEARVARMRAEEAANEVATLREMIRRHEDTIEYLRAGYRAGGVTTGGYSAAAAAATVPVSRAQQLVHDALRRLPGSATAPPTSSRDATDSVKSAVSQFSNKLDNLAYENSKLRYKVADLKSRLAHDPVVSSRSGSGEGEDARTPPRPLYQISPKKDYPPPQPEFAGFLHETAASRALIEADRIASAKLDRAREKILSAKKQVSGGDGQGVRLTLFPDTSRVAGRLENNTWRK